MVLVKVNVCIRSNKMEHWQPKGMLAAKFKGDTHTHTHTSDQIYGSHSHLSDEDQSKWDNRIQSTDCGDDKNGDANKITVVD